MKLTKGMKKALSVLLAGSLAVTGMGAFADTASARLVVKSGDVDLSEETPVFEWTGTAECGSDYEYAGVDVETDEDSTLEITPNSGNNLCVVMNVDLAEVENPYVVVEATETEVSEAPFGVCSNDWKVVYAGVNDGKNSAGADAQIAADETTIQGSLDKDNEEYLIVATGRTIKRVAIYDVAAGASTVDVMDDFTVSFGTTGALKENETTVTGDGIYALEAQDDETGFTGGYFGIETTVYNGQMAEGFDMKLLALSVAHTEGTTKTITTYEAVEGKDDFCFADSNIKSQVRIQILNQWAKYTGDDGITTLEDAENIDAFGGALEGWEENDVVTAYFQVSNMGKVSDDALAESDVPEAGTKTETVQDTNNPDNTQQPTQTPSGTAIASGTGVSTVVSPGTASITVKKAKRTVLVAAGKSKTVPFTAAIDTERNATEAATISAVVSGNTKVKATVSGSNVTIKATKKAVKGSTAKVVLTSENASGAAVKSATIKVTVQNKVKKIAAKKKTVSLKKGKTAKVVITIKKAENIKKLTTDIVKVTSKLVTLKTAKIAKKKITVTLKAKKKAGSKAATIKVGTQKVKITTQVK